MSQNTKKRKSKVSSKTALVLSSCVLALCVGLLLLTVSISASAEPTSARTENTAPAAQPAQSAAQPAQPSQPPLAKKTSAKRATIYIVLDDAGTSEAALEPFLNLPFDLSVAVMPGLAETKASALAVSSSGKTLLLHQPMQALNLNVNPGPASIKPQMTTSEIKNVLNQNIAELNRPVGINNHEGSLITENAEMMAAIMQVCKENNLFYLDSRTTSKSVCKQEAEKQGVKFYERNVFLDNISDSQNMIKEFKRGIGIADKTGSVIMIGHVWSGKNLADVLEKMYSEYSKQGYEFSSF